jgi:hypothetical protein
MAYGRIRVHHGIAGTRQAPALPESGVWWLILPGK